MRTVSIIIPVYNEEKRIGKTIQEVIKADTLGMKKEIIVVDDGSTDGTLKQVKGYLRHFERLAPRGPKDEVGSREILLKQKDPSASVGMTDMMRIIFLQNKKNQGKGAALKIGFKKAKGDILMVQDADLEYSPCDYQILLKPFIEHKAEIVYGSRNKARKEYKTAYSYLSFFLGGIFLTWIINVLFGTHLTDQPTGYKLFSKNIKKFLLKPTENRFSYESAVTALLAKHTIPFIEVPIHYKPRSIKEGKKINAFDFISSVIVAIKYKMVN